ncbi:MAG: c-type cytochrome [Bradymonadaceae bacterium]|nr:c-type cytochrome [Lujinxingiaceae bacterium]
MKNHSTLKIRLGLVCLTLLGTLVAGCPFEVGIPASGNKTFGELNPIRGMHEQTSYRDQEMQPIFRADQPQGMRRPPAMTVPIMGSSRTELAISPEASARLANPVAITEDSLNYGQFLFNTNCAVCHGHDGNGLGTIVAAGAFAQPPSLTSARVRGWEDGRVYHVITYGQGIMWPYKNQLTELERWAAVNYVRALQRAQFPEPMDLERIRQ